MTVSNGSSHIYALRQGVRVFRSGDEIRFRRGVWSFNEAIVRLAGQNERVVAFFNLVYSTFADDRPVNVAEIGQQVGASDEELKMYSDLLDNLKRQQYLQHSSQNLAADVVATLLGGNLSGFEQYVNAPRRVLFFTDSGYAARAAKTLAAEIGLPLDLLDESTLQALALADLTTRTDAVQHVETEMRFEKLFEACACVLGCVAAPNLSLLRNLNRLLIAAEKPLILGLIDGPFISVLSTLATETGCFECYEQRQLARLEDTLVYHQFAKSTANGSPAVGPRQAPALNILTSAVISEGYLYSAAGVLRLAGRVVNTYLPLLEIQVQDLLRVPYCPACGFISKAEMNEFYTSSKRIVDEMLSRVEVEN